MVLPYWLFSFCKNKLCIFATVHQDNGLNTSYSAYKEGVFGGLCLLETELVRHNGVFGCGGCVKLQVVLIQNVNFASFFV